MDLKEFTLSMAHAVQKKLPDRVEVLPKSVCKNNGVVLQGLLFRRYGSKTAPTIYMEEFFAAYQRGEAFSGLVEEVVNGYEKHGKAQEISADFFLHYEEARKTIVYRLVHYQRNKKLLSQVPHLPYLDLAIVFCCLVGQSELGTASILIRNEHLEMWKATHSMLYAEAKINTPQLLRPKLCSIAAILGDAWGKDQEGGPLLHMLTNEQQINGASAILYEGMLERCADLCQGDYFLLPSSIHEVMIAPYERRLEVSALKAIVREANETQVEPYEILSDSVYFYNRDEKKLLVL